MPHYFLTTGVQHQLIGLLLTERLTGVTTFFINENIDTGDIIDQDTVEVSVEENAGELHDKLKNTGANLVIKTVQKIISNDFSLKPQINLSKKINSATKLNKDNRE